jgi:DNA-binding transcriptional MerR regulator
MPDYFLAEHVATKLGLSVRELLEFETRGVVRSTEKNGRIYYSCQDVYRLRGVLYFTRHKGLSLQEARARLASRSTLSSGSFRYEP